MYVCLCLYVCVYWWSYLLEAWKFNLNGQKWLLEKQWFGWISERLVCSVQVVSCVHSLFCWDQASPAKIIAEAPMRFLPEFPFQVQMLGPPGDPQNDTPLEETWLLFKFCSQGLPLPYLFSLPLNSCKIHNILGIVEHTFNPCTAEAETDLSLWVQEQKDPWGLVATQTGGDLG